MCYNFCIFISCICNYTPPLFVVVPCVLRHLCILIVIVDVSNISLTQLMFVLVTDPSEILTQCSLTQMFGSDIS